MKHIKLKTINLKTDPQLNERWLQDIIAEDPSILGLGELILKDKERIHPGAGRLDLLLQDDNYNRFEVEVQLGSTDPSHIIRTIEYWDIEKKKYPQYNHTAVIIAEDITSRFLNVISLFNGFIPVIAIQVTAIETSDGIGLQFTKIIDTVKFGYIDEDKEVSELTDRDYWEKRATKETLSMSETILEMVGKLSPSIKFNYTKFYMGFCVDDHVCNFAICRPRKMVMNLEIQLPQNKETEEVIDNSNLKLLDYRSGTYRIKLSKNDIEENEELLMSLLQQAYILKK